MSSARGNAARRGPWSPRLTRFAAAPASAGARVSVRPETTNASRPGSRAECVVLADGKTAPVTKALLHGRWAQNLKQGFLSSGNKMHFLIPMNKAVLGQAVWGAKEPQQTAVTALDHVTVRSSGHKLSSRTMVLHVLHLRDELLCWWADLACGMTAFRLDCHKCSPCLWF